MNFVHFTLVTMCAFVYILSVSVGSTDALDKCYTCNGTTTTNPDCKSQIEATCVEMGFPAAEDKTQVCFTIKSTKKDGDVHETVKGCAYEDRYEASCTAGKNDERLKDVSCKSCKTELCNKNGAGIYTASAVFVAILTALVTRAL